MSGPTFRMINLGCSKNQVDGEVMLGLLGEKGWVPSASEEADVVIVNTCSFIREAQEESVETILAAAAAKERGKCRLLVVAGCLPQRFHRELPGELPEVDLFLGTGEFHRLPELLEKSMEGRLRRRRFIEKPTYLYDHRTPRVSSTASGSAYIKIAEGCENRCSYCVIPQVRGRLRSRELSSVLQEAEQAVRRGVKEINLIAQDVTSYGRDLGGGADLARLLGAMTRIEGLPWIRLLYAHPARISTELIDLIRAEEKIVRYLDLPLQHIDDRILRAMGRRVSERQVRELVVRLKREIPGLVLRTTLMVGFPGETEKSFGRLLDFVRETEFDRLGAFRYSREEGTPAAAMGGQAPEEVKGERFHRLMSLQKKISRRKQKALIGSQVPVLVERPGSSPRVLWEGRTQGQAPEVDGLVFLSQGQARPGEIVQALITRATTYDLFGEIRDTQMI